MGETTVKLAAKHYNTVKALSDKSGLSVREVVDNLLNEGLNNAKELGKAVSSNDNVVDKLRADMEALKRTQRELKGRVDDIEVEVGEQAAEAAEATEITREDLLGKSSKASKTSKPGKRETDETVYFCVHCAKNGKTVELDAEEKPESCPGCGRKLNWKGEEGSGIGTVLLGLLALAFLGRTIPQR